MTRCYSMVRLGDLVSIVMGQAPSSKDTNFEGRGEPFVKVGEFGALRPLIREWTTNPLKRAVKTDVLLCVVGATCGKVNLGEDCAIGRSVAALRPNRTKLDQFFLHYFMLTLVQHLRSGSVGAAQTVISKEMIQTLRIPLVSLEKQQRIVAILDEAFDGIATAKANAEKNLQNARTLVSTGYQAITEGYDRSQWPIVQVANLAASHKGSMRTGPFGSQLLHSEFVDEGIAVLGIDNAVANEFRWDRRRYITEEKYRQLARYRVLPGDVLITIMGTCGRCAVVPDDIPQAINTKHLCCITLDRGKCQPEFLHTYFLHDPTARDYLSAQAKGSIMAGLNMGIISELPVRLPSLQQQVQIVDRFDSLRAECLRLEAVQAQKLAALDELKKSLLHRAFNGDL